MKIALLLFAVASALLVDAVRIADEDIESPLVSYLLAKLQRLESKIMVRPNIRSRKTRQTTEKPTKQPIAAKQCDCPLDVVTYVC